MYQYFNLLEILLWEDYQIQFNPYVKIDNENESIVYNDISSQYPYELSKKLPYKNYKFVEKFDENKYGQDKDYGCIMLCDVKTTDKIRNDCYIVNVLCWYQNVK